MSKKGNEYDFFDTSKKIDNDKVSSVKRKWIRCSQGIIIYSVGKTRFLELAREAGAAVKINGTVLVDSEKLDSYIETFRI